MTLLDTNDGKSWLPVALKRNPVLTYLVLLDAKLKPVEALRYE